MPARTAHLAVLLALAALAATPPAAPASDLPLGPRSLDERRTTLVVAPGVTWTHIFRKRGLFTGPWRVDVLTIDRRGLRGRLSGVLSNGRIAGRETTSAMGRRSRAVAGVNGGYFTIEGDSVGALGLDGQLLSEPLGGRTGLLVPTSPLRLARVAPLRFEGSVQVNGVTRLLDGVDRKRGEIPACGGRGGDRPTERIDPRIHCTDPSELVLFSPRFGPRTLTSGGGTEAVLRGGAVTAFQRSNGPIPRDGQVLSASGDAVSFLRANAAVGSRPLLDLAVRSGRRRSDPSGYSLIVGAGPRLLGRGRVRVPAAREGFLRAFSHFRHPRTLAGVRRDGRILLVTIDGRRPGYSVGATLRESARVLRSLGAREAVNLDGGGSTTMVIRGRVVNRPSDPGGERAVSDGLFVLP
jgi:hypothetical protein